MNTKWGTESPVKGPRRYWPDTGSKLIGPPPAPRPAKDSGQAPTPHPTQSPNDKGRE
jgi:hypothetical protein